MLLRITQYDALEAEKLMAVYAESNLENTAYFYPDETDQDKAVRQVEAGFLDHLKTEFFGRDGTDLWVLEEDGVWLSALRTYRVQAGLYYLEALETRPDRREEGCAVRLLTGVMAALKLEGPFRLCSCVSKKNAASLNTHRSSGFSIVSEAGYDYLLRESDDRDYGMEYRYSGE